MVLVDTSVLIDYLRGDKTPSTERVQYVLESRIPFGINSFIYQEVLQGVKSEKEVQKVKEYLDSQRFYALQHPRESFAAAAHISLRCRRSGITIGSTIDCLIAQTAVENNLFLLHNDSDFDRMARVIELKIFSF